MEALGLGDVKNKIINAKNNASAAVDKVAGRAQAAWNTSPLGTALHGGPTTYDNRGSNLQVSAPKPKAPTGSPAKPTMPKYHKGTDYVPETGPAVLEKGEAVLDTKEAAKHRAAKGKNMTKVNAMSGPMSGAADALGGKAETPKKEVKHMHIKKAANGGHIVRHEHTSPEHHPDEEHTTKSDDELASHVLQHMGTPNPGEQEADAGQSGIPGAAAQGGAPAAGAPAMPGM